MLPFLEWVADSWNPLLHEERLPNRNIGDNAVESLAITRNAPTLASEVDISEWEQEWYDSYQRHSLRAARSGGLFPTYSSADYKIKLKLAGMGSCLQVHLEAFASIWLRDQKCWIPKMSRVPYTM